MVTISPQIGVWVVFVHSTTKRIVKTKSETSFIPNPFLNIFSQSFPSHFSHFFTHMMKTTCGALIFATRYTGEISCRLTHPKQVPGLLEKSERYLALRRFCGNPETGEDEWLSDAEQTWFAIHYCIFTVNTNGPYFLSHAIFSFFDKIALYFSLSLSLSLISDFN